MKFNRMGCCFSKVRNQDESGTSPVQNPISTSLSLVPENEKSIELKIFNSPQQCGDESDENFHGPASTTSLVTEEAGVSTLLPRQEGSAADFSNNFTAETNSHQVITETSNIGTINRAFEEWRRRSDEYFRGAASTTPDSRPNLSPMEKLAHKCVSVKFLIELYEQVVQPYRPTMTVKEVVEEIIIPATIDQQCSFIDLQRPNMYVTPHAFVSHAFGNPIRIIVENLKAYYKDAIYSEIYVWIDIFIINQHRPGDDLHGGHTLKATIEASGSVLVCLDKNTLPLFRLWCLYEIGSTPIDKLVLLTHGFDDAELGLAYGKIDATTADCFSSSDKERIQSHIRTMMVEQKIVDSDVSIMEALTAFTRVLKLLLILKPTSYSADMAALLARAAGYERYPLRETVERACSGGKLVVITGGSGEGKSTLAAALATNIPSIHAYHFCKLADIRRQDRGLVMRSLSYQLAIRFPAFAQALLAMTPPQVESLSDEIAAFKLLLEIPLRMVRDSGAGFQANILIDALDESGADGMMASLLVCLDNVLREDSIEGNSSINVIVTTRPEPALLAPLRSHWKGERYQEISPAELRGEDLTCDRAISPLLMALTELIRQSQPNLTTASLPLDLNTAYGLIFDRGVLTEQHRAVLEVVLASCEPRSLSDLKAMGLLETARTLPTYGELFLERENKLHLLHRSIAEWLLDPIQGVVDITSGHARLAEHIWETMLQPWLLLPSSVSSSFTTHEPMSGSYSLKYALAHLREAGRSEEIRTIIFRLPWLQAMLREKGLGALIKDLLSLLPVIPTLAAAAKKMVAILSLSSAALLGSDAGKCLPQQVLGRLRETKNEECFQQLRMEAESFLVPDGKSWLKPLKSSMKTLGSLEMTMIGHKGEVFALAILPDGRIVSGSTDNTVRIWSPVSGDCEKILSGHVGTVRSVAILPDGRIVSGSDDMTVRIWNPVSGDCELIFSGHEGSVNALSILPDGRIVSGSSDETVRIWNSVVSGDCEKILSGHENTVSALAILPNGFIVSGSTDNTVRIWNPVSGDCERILSGHVGTVRSVAILPDGRIVSGCDHNTVRIWDPVSGDCDKILSGHENTVSALSILPDGRIVSCSWDQTVRIWNPVSGDCELILSGHQHWVRALTVLPDGRIVSGSDDTTVRIWNPVSGDCEKTPSCHKGSITTVCILPDGRVVSGSWDKTVRIWNPTSGNCEKILSGHEYGIKDVIVLSDGRFISTDTCKKCLLWSPVTKGGVGVGGFRSKSVSRKEYNSLLKEGAASPDNSVVAGRVAPGYSITQNCVQSESFGRVFVDEAVQWVVKTGDVIIVFEENGKDHWFKEVPGEER